MTTDVGTTKRKPLTPTQRLKLFEDHKGICVICGGKINFGEAWIDEHVRALGLAGTNDMDNRAPAHVKCAEAKTHDEDMPRITKAKAQKRAALGIKRDGPKLQSRGFAPPDKPKREPKPRLPPRAMFED
jgi:5-methylcytosine-specific restriction enzyme A